MRLAVAAVVVVALAAAALAVGFVPCWWVDPATGETADFGFGWRPISEAPVAEDDIVTLEPAFEEDLETGETIVHGPVLELRVAWSVLAAELAAILVLATSALWLLARRQRRQAAA